MLRNPVNFLDLPRELRDVIYRNLMHNVPTLYFATAASNYRVAVEALNVNYQIRRELLEVFFSLATINQRLPKLFAGPKLMPPSLLWRVKKLHLLMPDNMIYGESLFGVFSDNRFVPCDWCASFARVERYLEQFPNLVKAIVRTGVTISLRTEADEEDSLKAWESHPLRASMVLDRLEMEINDLSRGNGKTWRYWLAKDSFKNFRLIEEGYTFEHQEH